MKDQLYSDLKEYLISTYPDLLLNLQEQGKVQEYLHEKIAEVEPIISTLTDQKIPAYIIRAKGMEWLLEHLEPSKFMYVYEVLEEEFLADFEKLQKAGILTYEIMNIIILATPVFNQFQFSEENKDNRFLQYAIIGVVQEYFQHN